MGKLCDALRALGHSNPCNSESEPKDPVRIQPNEQYPWVVFTTHPYFGHSTYRSGTITEPGAFRTEGEAVKYANAEASRRVGVKFFVARIQAAHEGRANVVRKEV